VVKPGLRPHFALDRRLADYEPGEWATQPNLQRIPAGGRVIEVKMGSIHAVKGETHFATLVLQTHNHKHAIKSLLPWLLEDASALEGIAIAT
jgi:hypothetical protein